MKLYAFIKNILLLCTVIITVTIYSNTEDPFISKDSLTEKCISSSITLLKSTKNEVVRRELLVKLPTELHEMIFKRITVSYPWMDDTKSIFDNLLIYFKEYNG